MPIHYDIETDELYLAGPDKGIENGVEQHQHDTVIRLLKFKRFTDKEIAAFAGVTAGYVQRVKKGLKN